MADHSADRERLLELICREVGHTEATLGWSFLGGRFDGGNSPVGEVSISFAQLQKVKKISARVSELKKQHKVKSSAPRYLPIRGTGLYPGVGSGVQEAIQRAQQEQARDRHRQMATQPAPVRIDPALAGVSNARECMALLD